MNRTTARGMAGLALLALLALGTGCTTKAAKKALNKAYGEDAYTGFGKNIGKDSERAIRKAEPVADDMDPEKAVEILVDQLQRREPAYQILAEDQLRVWATKQGVAEIIVRKVRELLKRPRIEIRAPALRLTMAYGERNSIGDMIEVLADEEYGMRDAAFKWLRVKTGRDFGYSPSGGQLAKAKAVDAWRKWWQTESFKGLARETPVQGIRVPEPPSITSPNDRKPPRDEESPDDSGAKSSKTKGGRFHVPAEDKALQDSER